MYSDKAPMPNNWQSPFAELAYFIRNFFLRLTTNSFMSGIPNHSLHSLITSTDTVRKIFIKTLRLNCGTELQIFDWIISI